MSGSCRPERHLPFYLPFFLPRSGTTVVTAGASGAIGFGGDVSFFGFLASLVLRAWPLAITFS